MIQSENGPVLPNNSFGMLLSFHLTIMLFYADKQGRGKRKVEYGIPFFDDLDFAAKTATLYQLTLCLFDPDAELLPENVYTASALAALENFVQESVRQEVEMRHWYKKKYGEEEHAVRSMVLTAYQSRFPHDECPDENSHDVSAFQCAASRLFSEIRPKPYYWLVDTELSKRKELMERLNIPNDYFESFFGQYEMSKKDRENHTQSLFADALARCETMWKRIFKTEMNVEKCWWMAKDE